MSVHLRHIFYIIGYLCYVIPKKTKIYLKFLIVQHLFKKGNKIDFARYWQYFLRVYEIKLQFKLFQKVASQESRQKKSLPEHSQLNFIFYKYSFFGGINYI